MPTVNFLNNYGTLTYTIDKSGVIGKNDEVTMKFTFKPTKQKMYGYEITIRNPKQPSSGRIFAQGSKSISKGSSGSVTLTFTPGSQMSAAYFSNRSAALIMDVTMWLNSAMDEGESTDPFQPNITVVDRIAPAISDAMLSETTWNDTSDFVIYPPPAENLPLNIFGIFVQGVSKPKLTAYVTLDPLDTTLTASYALTFKQGDTELYSATGSVTDNGLKILTGIISAYGYVDCVLTITDSAGLSSSTTITFEVLQYSAPSISQFTPKRYEYVYDANGDLALQESESGTIVIFDFAGSITPISGNGNDNFGELSVTYGPILNESDRTTVIINSTTDADMVLTHEFADVVFSDAEDYVFIASFRDYFASTKFSVEVYKAGADFDVTMDGVAVGQVSTGTSENKKFEVNEDYTSHFYGGIASFGSGDVCTSSQHALGIQCGIVSADGGTSSGSYKTYNVVFGTPFAEGCTPIVLTGFGTTSTAGTFGRNSCAVVSGTETNVGFSLRHFNGDSSTRSPGLRWIAIGWM